MINGLDLFSGIGGLSIALEPWVRTVAYCENDRYSQSVLLRRMGNGSLPLAPIWDDVQTLSSELIGGPIDIVYGGFPCQDISVAGHGVGLGGKRSGLVSEIYRLIDGLLPRFVFLENVPAIRTRGADVVTGELARRGYDCRWETVSAQEVGASFIGIRWFLLAAANSETLRVKQGRGRGKSRQAETLNLAARDTRLTPWTPERGFESRVFGAGDGIPFAVDRDRCLGNAVVPEQAREAFMRLMGIELSPDEHEHELGEKK